MTTISRNWNTDLNYWEVNPIIKTIGIFKDLYKRDKTKNKIKSSKLMWAIAMYVDPHEDNPWRSTNPKDKAKLIALEYLEDEKFSFEDDSIKELVQEYENRCLSIPEKELARLYSKLSERGDFIADTKYTMDSYEEGKLKKGTADQLDKMMTTTIKIYEQLEKVEEMLAEQSINTRLRGDEAESATDEGLI